MVRCGEWCKSCKAKCQEVYSEQYRGEVECLACGGSGISDYGAENCGRCNGTGYFAVTQCPNDYIGRPLRDAINMAGWALQGEWPEAGGLLDQSNWFVDLVTALSNDQITIDRERREAAVRR